MDGFYFTIMNSTFNIEFGGGETIITEIMLRTKEESVSFVSRVLRSFEWKVFGLLFGLCAAGCWCGSFQEIGSRYEKIIVDGISEITSRGLLGLKRVLQQIYNFQELDLLEAFLKNGGMIAFPIRRFKNWMLFNDKFYVFINIVPSCFGMVCSFVKIRYFNNSIYRLLF